MDKIRELSQLSSLKKVADGIGVRRKEWAASVLYKMAPKARYDEPTPEALKKVVECFMGGYSNAEFRDVITLQNLRDAVLCASNYDVTTKKYSFMFKQVYRSPSSSTSTDTYPFNNDTPSTSGRTTHVLGKYADDATDVRICKDRAADAEAVSVGQEEKPSQEGESDGDSASPRQPDQDRDAPPDLNLQIFDNDGDEPYEDPQATTGEEDLAEDYFPEREDGKAFYDSIMKLTDTPNGLAISTRVVSVLAMILFRLVIKDVKQVATYINRNRESLGAVVKTEGTFIPFCGPQGGWVKQLARVINKGDKMCNEVIASAIIEDKEGDGNDTKIMRYGFLTHLSGNGLGTIDLFLRVSTIFNIEMGILGIILTQWTTVKSVVRVLTFIHKTTDDGMNGWEWCRVLDDSFEEDLSPSKHMTLCAYLIALVSEADPDSDIWGIRALQDLPNTTKIEAIKWAQKFFDAREKGGDDDGEYSAHSTFTLPNSDKTIFGGRSATRGYGARSRSRPTGRTSSLRMPNPTNLGGAGAIIPSTADFGDDPLM